MASLLRNCVKPLRGPRWSLSSERVRRYWQGALCWKDFADKNLHWLVGQGKFSYSQLDQISHLHPRVKLSLARAIANEHKTKIVYRDILHPKQPRESLTGQHLYNALFRLSTIFVTTN